MKRNTNKSARRPVLAAGLVLTVAVILGVMLGVGGFATESRSLPDVSATVKAEGGTYLDICAANVDYEEYMHIWYAVAYDFGELGLDAANVKMAFWTSPQSSYNKNNAVFIADKAQKTTVTPAGGSETEAVILHSDDIPAAHMVDDLYARAFIENGDEVYYSEVLKYSVLQYVQDRYLDAEEDADSVSDAQMDLYKKILDYGANAQKVLDYKADRLANADYLYLNVERGALADGTDTALLLPDESVDVYAPASYNGNSFVKWMDDNGDECASTTGFRYTADAISGNTKSTLSAIFVGSALPGVALGTSSSSATTFGDGYSGVWGQSSYKSQNSLVYADVNGDGNLVTAINSKKYAKSGHGLTVKATNSKTASSKGMVYEFDFIVNECAPGVILMEWDLGSPSTNTCEHRHNLVSTDDGRLTLNTYNSTTGTYSYIDERFNVGEWNHFKIEYHFGELPAVTKAGYLNMAAGTDADDYFYAITYVNGKTVAVTSMNYSEIDNDGNDTFRFYAYGASGEHLDYTLANANFRYVDEVASAVETVAANPTLHVVSLATVEEQWIDTMKALANMENLKDGTVDQIKAELELFADLYAHEGGEVWRWVASLWDPEVGGFYYSNSARDTYGYLPDVESTGQVATILNNLGITGSNGDMLPTPELEARLSAWILSLQSNEDGFFYHPQWGTDVTTSRRSRDMNKQSYAASQDFGRNGKLLFDSVAYRANGSSYEGNATEFSYTAKVGGAAAIPTVTLRRDAVAMVSKVVATATETGLSGHLSSVAAFQTYLEELKAKETKADGSFNSYSFGHTISAQAGQIGLNKDLILTCINFMNGIQDEMRQYQIDNDLPLTGLWTQELHYDAINGLLKTGGAYDSLADSYIAILEKEKAAALEENPNADVSMYEYKGECRIRYADDAFASVLTALTMDSEATGKWEMDNVVDVYNPPNGATHILNSLKKHYGNDPELAAFAEATLAEAEIALQENALTILRETREKVAKFLKVDANGYYSFSYNVKYSSSSSQSEAAAVPNSAEGDVNGTSLAISARANTLTLLGIPYVDITTRSYLPDYYEMILAKTESSEKSGEYLAADADTTNTFTNASDLPEAGTTGNVTLTHVDGTLKFYEHNTNGGGGVNLYSVKKLSADGINRYVLDVDMKISSANTKSGTTTQLFLRNDAGANILRIDLSVSGTTATLKYMYWTDGSTASNPEKNQTIGTVDLDEWFNIRIEILPDSYDGANATATTDFVTVTLGQGGSITSFATPYAVKNTADLGSFNYFLLYGLSSATTECYLDNLVCERYFKASDLPSDADGVYYFDTPYTSATGNTVVDEPGKTNGNKVLKVQVGEYLPVINVDGNTQNKYNTQVNYNYLESRVVLDTYAAGEVAELHMTYGTSDGQRSIAGIKLSMSEDGKLTVRDTFGNTLFKDLAVAKKLGDKVEMTVKLYYYANSNRFDVVIRYTDLSADATTYPNGKAEAIAATVTGLPANANYVSYDRAAVLVQIGSVVYIDDVFARNYTE